MQILKINSNSISNRYYTQPKKEQTTSKQEEVTLHYANNYSPITFQAKVKIIDKKTLNIESEKNRILKHLNEILAGPVKKNIIKDNAFKLSVNSIMNITDETERLTEILNLSRAIYKDKCLSLETKLRRLKFLQKTTLNQEKLSKNIGLKNFVEEKNKQDEKIDYKLINMLKNAVSEDEFRLKKIYDKRYQELKDIESLEDLRGKYPNIKIPPTPQEVIAHKIIDLLPKKAFVEYAKNYNNEIKEQESFFDKQINPIIEIIAAKNKILPEDFKSKIQKQLWREFNDKFENNEYNNFSNIPERKNIKPSCISDCDIKLLNIDFEDFVLYIIKKHYLESEKLNQIKYNDNISGITIPVSSLGNTDYKFDKFPDKIRLLIQAGEAIVKIQRSYALFDLEYLKSKLNFYAGTKIGNDIKLLEKIIDFDSSEDADKQYLSRFLEELDLIYDEKQTTTEALETIKKEDIRPHTKHKLNKLEQQRAIEKLKKEQELKFKLDSAKEDFDNAINLLYANELTEIANICTPYRPKQLSPGQIGRADFLVKLINKHIKSNENSEVSQLEYSVKCWDKYYQQLNSGSEAQLFEEAKKYGKKDGELDVIKAGQYLLNAEIVELYPDSLEEFEYPELLTKIMEKTNNDNDKAIKYLCKLSDYELLSSQEQVFISEFIHLFDLKDNIDKIILKHIIENHYIYQDSTLPVIENGGELSNQKATIAAAAKQSILEEKNFPNYIDLFINFENALPNFARAKGESGIKLIGRNDKTVEYKVELKISRYLDRLFSSNNDLYFDIYSEKGLH